MKKKMLSILLATSLLAGVSTSAVSLKKATAEGTVVNIAVDEELYGMNILTVTEYSDTLDWVYRMTYDTLITLDGNGNFAPGLATEWLVSVEYEDPEQHPSNLIFESWPAEWFNEAGPLSAPPGWKTLHNLAYDHSAFLDWVNSPNESSVIIDITLQQGVYTYWGEEITAEMIYDIIAASYHADDDTLFHKQWSPFAYSLSGLEGAFFVPNGIEIEDDYHFKLYPKIAGTGMSWLDVLYSLTEPMAGIFDVYAASVNDEYIQGSGAYIFDDFNEGQDVTLSPNTQWALGTAPMQDVKFVFAPNDNSRWYAFSEGDVDVVVLPPAYYEGNMLSVVTNTVEGNPLYLVMNKNNTVLSDNDVRKAIAKMIPNDSEPPEGGVDPSDFIQFAYDNNTISPIFNNTLSYSANGIWTKDAYSDLSLTERNNLIETMNNQIFTLLYYGNDLYTSVAQELQACFSNVEAELLIYGAQSKEEFQRLEREGTYDFVLKDIEVSNLNSAYHELYGKISTDMDDMLQASKYALGIQPYAILHSQVQIKLHNDASYVNLGWQKKMISHGITVSGITFPTGGFSPMGDVSRIDFRGVTKI